MRRDAGRSSCHPATFTYLVGTIPWVREFTDRRFVRLWEQRESSEQGSEAQAVDTKQLKWGGD